MKKKIVTVKEANNILKSISQSYNNLGASLRHSEITIGKEIEVMNKILQGKLENEELSSVFSKSFLDMKKIYKV